MLCTFFMNNNVMVLPFIQLRRQGAIQDIYKIKMAKALRFVGLMVNHLAYGEPEQPIITMQSAS